MSKRYKQTTLNFFRSHGRGNKSPNKRPHPYKKSYSDSSMQPSYAQAAERGRGRGSSKSPIRNQGTAGRGSFPNSYQSLSSSGPGSSKGESSHFHDRPSSPSLFSDDEMESNTVNAISRQHSSSTTAQMPRSVSLSMLRRAPECYTTDLPDLMASPAHKVLFRVPPQGWNGEPLIPYPNEYVSKNDWDDNHVYMPCSRQNLIPSDHGGQISRWTKIEEVLRQPITGFFELEEAILSYNLWYAKRWSFNALRDYLTQSISQREQDMFFTHTLPFMQKLALKLPLLVTQPVPILKQGKQMKLTMSQQQVACLLANAFFCTFPKRNARMKSSLLPDINFSNLFSGGGDRKEEKLKCIIHYFNRIKDEMPTGTLTYSRQVLDSQEEVDWMHCKAKLTDLYVSTDGTIEDDGTGMLQADFANKFIGGGVLGHGLVQEEIRFVICPEMILARLFTQVLQDNEVLIMTGCERFCSYTGYSDSFLFAGDYIDTTPRDSWGRRHTEVVAMDALHFRASESQFERDKVLREANKAYCAFINRDFTSNLPAICTGNWGCGAFRGDKHLKALIQIMAASVAGRQVCYFTFQDEELCTQLEQIHNMLQSNSITVKEIYRLITDYRNKEVRSMPKYVQTSLFQFISTALGEPLRTASSKTNSSASYYTADDFASIDSTGSDDWEMPSTDITGPT